MLPKKMNLGSGKDWHEDCFNVDVNDYWQPDAILDFNRPLPLGEPLETRRFGSALRMLTWFINTKKIASPRSKSIPSRRFQLPYRIVDSAAVMVHFASEVEISACVLKPS